MQKIFKIEIKQNSCPQCGTALPAGAKFCSTCGCKIESSAVIFCPDCGTKCEAGAKFCPACGNRLGDSIKKV